MAVDKVKYWLGIADYDMETAEAMYAAGRWLYVGFMCHQVIEKSLKAYWNAMRDDDPPYIHNLKRLASGVGLYAEMEVGQKAFIDLLTPLNIEARYPSYKEDLSKALGDEICKDIINKTKALQQWIKQMLSNLPASIKA